MRKLFLEILHIIQPWRSYIPISKREYFLHVILILDSALLLFKNSYESFLPQFASGIILSIDILVVTLWGFWFFYKLKSKENKIAYMEDNWYFIPGLLPFQVLRFFLLLSTIKLAIITYKFIKRGIKDPKQFINREINFRFIDLFVDAISDAIFLRSLERVEEVVQGMDFAKLNSEIMNKHKENIRLLIQSSLESKNSIKRLNDIPFLNGITYELSKEVTDSILESANHPAIGEIMKEINLSILKVMDDRVRKLDLDRITNESVS
jgi:hypothetical protein